jgi:penicillin-binding protein 1A
VTLLEMVSTYSTIAALGEYRKPVFVRRITDREGKVIADFAPGAPERALSQDASIALIDMLRGVVNRGTGGGVRYRFGVYGDVAGKTGTTQNNTDGWFILMHPQLVAGAWVGFNDNRVTMRSSYWGQGGHNALLLVGDFMRTALEAGKLDPNALLPGGRPPAPRQIVEPEEEIEELPGELDMEGQAPEDEMEVPDPDPALDIQPAPPQTQPIQPVQPAPLPEPAPVDPPPQGENPII